MIKSVNELFTRLGIDKKVVVGDRLDEVWLQLFSSLLIRIESLENKK